MIKRLGQDQWGGCSTIWKKILCICGRIRPCRSYKKYQFLCRKRRSSWPPPPTTERYFLLFMPSLISLNCFLHPSVRPSPTLPPSSAYCDFQPTHLVQLLTLFGFIRYIAWKYLHNKCQVICNMISPTIHHHYVCFYGNIQCNKNNNC